MLTLESLIAVISLCLTAFGLGYAIGSKDNNNHKIAAPVCKLRRLFLLT